MPDSAQHALLDAIDSIGGSSAFCSHSILPLVDPGVTLTDGTRIALPLPRAQIVDIQEAGEPAPFGKGAKTLYDESVRRCWQVDAGDFTCVEPEWGEVIEIIAGMVAEDLDVEDPVTAVPYKLLLYGKDGFFLPHRDTEKEGGMFGTLILALPSKHSGGKLFIRHQGKRKTVDFAKPENLRSLQYAAFFADCEHEVKPVTSGYRLCLVYNLVRHPTPGTATLPFTPEAETLVPHLHTLADSAPHDLSAILLEHHYTEDSLSLDALKAADRSRATALLAAAEKTGFTASLVLATFHQSGELEGADYGSHTRRRRRYWDDDDDFIEDDPSSGTMGDVWEETLTLDGWWHPTGKGLLRSETAIDPARLIAREAINAGDPDDKEGEGWTGNAGCTMEYWYYRAAIVLWPGDAEDDIRATYSFKETLEAWARTAKAGSASARFLRLGLALVRAAAQKKPYGDDLRTLVSTIAKSGHGDLLSACPKDFLQPIALEFDRTTWAKLFKAFGSAPFEHALTTPPEAKHEVSHFRESVTAALAALLSQKNPPPFATVLATWLVEHYSPGKHEYSHLDRPTPERLHTAIAASHLLGTSTLKKSLTGIALGDGTLRHLREMLAPALLDRPGEWKNAPPSSLFHDLLTAAKKQLGTECARPLTPFPDWARPTNPEQHSASTTYHGIPAAVLELETFLRNPDAKTQSFKYNESVRSRLESHINQNKLDLDHHTSRASRPFALVCTKNEASYKRALKRRSRDESLLAQLEVLPTG